MFSANSALGKKIMRSVKEMMSSLRAEKIETWFDLGLYIDRIRENRNIPSTAIFDNFVKFKEYIAHGIAFVTFNLSIDGVSIEIGKYAKSFRKIIKDIPIHFIYGKLNKKVGEDIIDPSYKKFEISEIVGFDNWKYYKDFFHKPLERGNENYNSLILNLWAEVLKVTEKLGKYIEENNIRLLNLINICSNPGNVSLALATVLISEFMGIPVINNNHDFYWEGGNRKIDRVTKKLKPGPRNHFFHNSHIGEVFSLIEVLYAWESRSWLQVNINKAQSRKLIEIYGHNPANVTEIGTAIDTEYYSIISKRKVLDGFKQLFNIFSKGKKYINPLTVNEVISKRLMTRDNPLAIFIGASRALLLNDFVNDNFIFLQPTRIISRKKIEVNFTLVKKLFANKTFSKSFDNNKRLKLTLLITGPIATGHINYAEKLLYLFDKMLSEVDSSYRKRIFLGFTFSEFDKPSFKQRYKEPLSVPELYNIASLVLLPSETEGRGLPIIESSACGTPIFARRYYPKHVFSYVIGEHLPSEVRFKVIEFVDDNIGNEVVNSVIDHILYPQDYMMKAAHNIKVVKHRYTLDSMKKNIEDVLYKLFLQICNNSDNMKLAIRTLNQHNQITEKCNKDLEYILNTKNRQYLPGYGKMRFMIFLKSLIDPSYFRVEEQQFRGMAMEFASNLVKYNPDPTPLSVEKMHKFYNAVDNLFLYRKGEVSIRVDHSLDYRHRNKNRYPYRDLTFQELTGVITMLFNKIALPPPRIDFGPEASLLVDFDHAILQLTNSTELVIDHRKRLKRRLADNVPIALFAGNYINYEMEFFVLQPLRKRLGLKVEEELTAKHLESAKDIAPIYIIKHNVPIGLSITADALKSYISSSTKSELKLLFEYGICKIIKSNQVTVGVHFEQLGKEALEYLKDVKDRNGFIIASGDHSAMMTDIVDIETFHIGKVKKLLASKIMGIPMGSGYVQWVPAGLRSCLAYPTPVQTYKDFSDALKSPVFKKPAKMYGEKRLLDILKQDAETNGSPVMKVLKSLVFDKGKKRDITTSQVMGIYKDGLPWSGAMAKVSIKNGQKKWKFSIMVCENNKTMSVLKFCDTFYKKTLKKPKIAWNGGYILNAELVGKLGIPESYIGSPLGLVISKKKVLCPPLFNKPAFGIFPDGTLRIERVNSSKGITLIDSNKEIIFTKDNYNLSNPKDKPCFYDLMYANEYIKGDGRVIYRFSGNVIKDIIHTRKGENVRIWPVGLSFSFPESLCPKGWDKIGKEVVFKLHFWNNIEYALEAGPMLVENGKVCIDMELEGWKTANSIRTQAARLDFLDMRGPKIAVGLDIEGNLFVLTVNGRIRESVGATHNDMAQILLSKGVITGMGFDPGGSSTLVEHNKTLNISPYNHEYEKDVYTSPPEPRAVANVVIGWQ